MLELVVFCIGWDNRFGIARANSESYLRVMNRKIEIQPARETPSCIKYRYCLTSGNKTKLPAERVERHSSHLRISIIVQKIVNERVCIAALNDR